MLRIRGLAKLVGTLTTVCKVIDVFGAPIRRFVPEDKLTQYDNALNAIQSACTVIRSINYNDGTATTSAPWGRE